MRTFTFILLTLIATANLYGKPTSGETERVGAVQDMFSLIDSLNDLAHSNRRSNPRLSLEYSLRAYQLCEGTDYPKGLASALHSMGTAKVILGRYDRGLNDLIQASTIRENLQDYVGLMSTLNNIGFAYSELNNDKKALEFYLKALSYREHSDNLRDVGVVLNNIGHLSLRQLDYDAALENFYKALEVNQQNGDDRGTASTLSNIGRVYHKTGSYDKGLEYHLRAYELGKNQDDKFGLISTLRNIAEVYLLKGKYADATNFALRSMLLAQEIGSLTEERNTAALLAQIYEKRGRYKEAAKHYKIESELKDSLFSIQQSEAMAQIQSAYEVESKVKENEFLRKEQVISDQVITTQRWLLLFSGLFLLVVLVLLLIILRSNRKIKSVIQELTQKNEEIVAQKETIQQKVSAVDEKNKELESINTIKNKLISVIAHDLKNPFNSITGYSELLVTDLSGYSNEEIVMFLGIIHDNAIKGNMLLDNLLQWSRLQTRTIQFLPVVHNLYKLVNDELFFTQHKAKEKQVSINNEVPTDLEVFADSNMLKTVIRNLLSNALKFTPKGGSVTIHSKAEAESVLVSVTDSGEGIEPHIKEKLFTGEAGVTTTSDSGEKGTGLGLMLCKDFVLKHKGEIWVESKPGEGASFFFRLPNKPSDTLPDS
jgi:signal transduction histidine kinase